jgi:serine/threonine protein kinase
MAIDAGRLNELFSGALACARADERQSYLAERCGEDAELRGQVESLLQAYEKAGGFLQKPLVAGPPTGLAETVGTVIGRYKLLQQIGEGGFGVVFMAEQHEPVRRLVALKIIKAGMDTKEVVARFEAERQALALMDHPNIARVLDGGTTDSGRPYFVMDLVKGVPITEFCEQHKLPTEARLRLFTAVCAGVQHAHQKGIIHRDLKPSNVLVMMLEGKPVPKVIDFGIAKAMGQKLTERTLFTRFEQLMGTPAYMSPEQAEWGGVDIDTRSDVYSLGALLYELLTGTPPFEEKTLARAALDDVRRMIRETEPPKPSTRLSQALDAVPAGGPAPADGDSQRHSSDARWRRQEQKRRIELVRGELDWIVMRALEKDRARRYETANGLAEDVERHLHGEPVLAGPPSNAYRVAKILKRHRVAALAAGGVILALVVGLGLALVGFAKARRQEKLAISELAVNRSVLDFLENDLLESASPFRSPNRNLTVRETLDKAAVSIEGRFAKQPLIEATLRYCLGRTYIGLGEPEKAELHLGRAAALLSVKPELNARLRLQVQMSLANLRLAQSPGQEGVESLRRLLEDCRRELGSEDETTLWLIKTLGDAEREIGRPAEAERLYKEALDKDARGPGSNNRDLLGLRYSLAGLYEGSGRFAEARRSYEEGLSLARRTLGAKDPVTLSHLGGLGAVELDLGNYAKAAALLDEGVTNAQEALGPRDRLLLDLRQLAVTAHGFLGDWPQCASLCRAIVESAPAPENVGEADFLGAIAALLVGRTNEYRSFASQLVKIAEGSDGPQTRRTALSVSFLMPGQIEELAPAFGMVDAITNIESDAFAMLNKGMADFRRRNYPEALAWLERPRHSAMSDAAARAGYFCAMIHTARGEPALARERMGEAEARLAALLRPGVAEWARYGWVALAREEAAKFVPGWPISPPLAGSAFQALGQQWEPVREHLKAAGQLASGQKWGQAREEYLAALRQPVFGWESALNRDCNLTAEIGISLLLAKDVAGYHELLKQWREFASRFPGPGWEPYLPLGCFLHELEPNSPMREQAVHWQVDPALLLARNQWTVRAFLAQTMIAYRTGQFERVLELPVPEFAPSGIGIVSNLMDPAKRGAAQVYRALALAKLGRVAEGRAQLQEAETALSPYLQTFVADNWCDLGLCQLALSEAQRAFAQLAKE